VTRTERCLLATVTLGATAWVATRGSGPTELQVVATGAGFALIGIPHGALDHLDIQPSWRTSYRALYLLAASVFALFWWCYPPIGLGLFALASAWHFGMADTEDMPIPSYWRPAVSATRGAMVLALLGRAPTLASSDALYAMGWLGDFGDDPVRMIVCLHLGVIALAARPHRLDDLLLETGAIALWLWWAEPIIGFAGYFVFWHSLPQLRKHVQHPEFTWWHAIPHTVGATAIVLFGPSLLVAATLQTRVIALAAIVGASIALPHILWVDWYLPHVHVYRACRARLATAFSETRATLG
jgi:Brp/Blh family beta-carotene 15,15'-monooxygenase